MESEGLLFKPGLVITKNWKNRSFLGLIAFIGRDKKRLSMPAISECLRLRDCQPQRLPDPLSTDNHTDNGKARHKLFKTGYQMRLWFKM